MFIGHFGVGLGAKAIDRKPSLGTLFFAAQFVDLLWPVFILIGIEKVKIEPGNTAFTPFNFIYYPFTHSLLAAIFWGVVFMGVYYYNKRKLRTSVILGLLVVSHWVLDFIVHRADLPLVPWSDFKVGLGVWNSIPLTIIIEGLIFCIGAWYYISLTEAKNKTGGYSMWGLLLFLVAIYIMNMFSAPPPSDTAIGWVGLSQWIIIAWGYWVDKNRIPFFKNPDDLY
jgi:membrane-bound metal-dependent hydrolase YbcI (DUF457 family)